MGHEVNLDFQYLGIVPENMVGTQCTHLIGVWNQHVGPPRRVGPPRVGPTYLNSRVCTPGSNDARKLYFFTFDQRYILLTWMCSSVVEWHGVVFRFADNEGKGMQGRDHYGGSTFVAAGRAVWQVHSIAGNHLSPSPESKYAR